jgi:hypothetical protein
MASPAVESLYDEYRMLKEYLDRGEQPSMASYVQNRFTRLLILNAGSYFEDQICNGISRFASTTKNSYIVYAIETKAVSRQFHTYAQWDKDSIPWGLFALFGDHFKKYIKNRMSGDENLKESIELFVKIVNQRNMLAHRNFTEFNPDFTCEEAYQRYRRASSFAENLDTLLIEGFATLVPETPTEA